MRFTFSTTGEGGNNLPLFMGGVSLWHQGQKPHFTEQVIYSGRRKEAVWKQSGKFPQNAQMSVLVGATGSERGRHICSGQCSWQRKPKKLGPRAQHCYSGVQGHQLSLLRHRQEHH